MKTTLLVFSSVLLLAGSPQASWAEESPLKSLLSFGNDKDQRKGSHSVQPVSRAKNSSPSIWTKMEQDMKRLNSGTKRFFSNTANALCWKKSSPPPASRTASQSWRTPSKPKEKTSWFKPFWIREEPPLPQSTQEFVGMERPRM